MFAGLASGGSGGLESGGSSEGCTVRAVTAGETRVFAYGPGFVVGTDGPRREPVIPAGGCDWPFLDCHLDQGKIAAAAVHFAMAHSYCVWTIWDVLHEAWNDIKVADRATLPIWQCIVQIMIVVYLKLASGELEEM